ncbi:hypothetical protein N9260_01725 [bacterium]|nr:hypothetical protein [bacterium]
MERIYLQNLLFNVDNRLVSISEYGIETTQPLFIGDPLDHASLSAFLGSLGFVKRGALTWYNAGLEIALSDVALHNVILVEDAVFPFDVWARRLAP